MTDAAAPAQTGSEISPARLRLVVGASALGTVFEWYDFFVYAALGSVLAPVFFAGLPDAQAFVFTLLTFGVGFVVRPIGAIVFGKMGDSIGRKATFLVTITLMGLGTFAIGLLPTYAQAGVLAPALLVSCRILQGFALGGEYGGAAIYVAEHADPKKRGAATGWIQTSAAFGLGGALLVVLITRAVLGETGLKSGNWGVGFLSGGWRIPFLLSFVLLLVSVWIRLQLEESPAFQKLKDQGQVSKRAYAESFLEWRNLKVVLLVFFSITMAQGVVWYTGFFYTQSFLDRTLKIDSLTVNLLMLGAVALSAPLYVFFAWLSDKVGRKPVMLFGMVMMLGLYFPGYQFIVTAGNPPLARAAARTPATIFADPADCTFQLDLTGGARQFASSCDIARGALANASVPYLTHAAPRGTVAHIRIGASDVESVSALGESNADIKKTRTGFEARLRPVLDAVGYPAHAPGPMKNWSLAEISRVASEKFAVFLMMAAFVFAATALYGPQAAALVELFPTRIRYTGLSVPYHIGVGWFGGLLPAIVFAINTATGSIYDGLWFPAVATAISVLVTIALLPETKDRDINAL
jgi:MFS family permease